MRARKIDGNESLVTIDIVKKDDGYHAHVIENGEVKGFRGPFKNYDHIMACLSTEKKEEPKEEKEEDQQTED